MVAEGAHVAKVAADVTNARSARSATSRRVALRAPGNGQQTLAGGTVDQETARKSLPRYRAAPIGGAELGARPHTGLASSAAVPAVSTLKNSAPRTETPARATAGALSSRAPVEVADMRRRSAALQFSTIPTGDRTTAAVAIGPYRDPNSPVVRVSRGYSTTPRPVGGTDAAFTCPVTERGREHAISAKREIRSDDRYVASGDNAAQGRPGRTVALPRGNRGAGSGEAPIYQDAVADDAALRRANATERRVPKKTEHAREATLRSSEGGPASQTYVETERERAPPTSGSVLINRYDNFKGEIGERQYGASHYDERCRRGGREIDGVHVRTERSSSTGPEFDCVSGATRAAALQATTGTRESDVSEIVNASIRSRFGERPHSAYSNPATPTPLELSEGPEEGIFEECE